MASSPFLEVHTKHKPTCRLESTTSLSTYSFPNLIFPYIVGLLMYIGRRALDQPCTRIDVTTLLEDI